MLKLPSVNAYADSGFIAVHVLRVLLQEGYKVRGTVRSAEKGDWLVKKFPGGDFTYVRSRL